MTPRSPNDAERAGDADRAGGADVVIIGAGIVGASVAYWLTRLDPSASVALIERDRTFARASSALSASSIRQQFSHPLNIRMSQFGLGFLREMGIAVEEKGYLYLGAAGPLRALNELQRANGADVALVAPAELSSAISLAERGRHRTRFAGTARRGLVRRPGAACAGAAAARGRRARA